MDRDKSLEFLQKCIDKTNALTNEEIIAFQEQYDLNCNDDMVDSAFEFIPPLYKRAGILQEHDKKNIS